MIFFSPAAIRPSAEGRFILVILLILSDKILIKWPALLLFSQMVDIAKAKRVVENKKNFGTRISTDFQDYFLGLDHSPEKI